MKHEWKKVEKELYLPKAKPTLVNVPRFKFFSICGSGNPNLKPFKEKVEVLYQASYGVRMSPKKGYTPEGYYEYSVYPLEGLWDLTAKGRTQGFDKNELVYKIMIRQPDFVDEALFNRVTENQYQKTNNPLLKEIVFEEIEDGLSVQILHLGPCDNEEESFSKMRDFIENNDLSIKTLVHREIYISDPRRTANEKLKTVLRYLVSNKKPDRI